MNKSAHAEATDTESDPSVSVGKSLGGRGIRLSWHNKTEVLAFTQPPLHDGSHYRNGKNLESKLLEHKTKSCEKGGMVKNRLGLVVF